MSVLLATLGQRPEAITFALDVLLPQYAYDSVVILHTEPNHSGIANSLRAVSKILRSDYSDLRVTEKELLYPNGTALLDIHDQHSAEAYYRAVVSVIKTYRQRGDVVHLLVAGGRKAMSIYATLAASLLFGVHDRVWTVLAPPDLMQKGQFHIPAGRYDDVHLVNLPLLPSRFLPNEIAQRDIDELLVGMANPRDRFLAELSPAERQLTDTLQQHHYASNDDLGARLNKSPKTIENQFGSIYMKMLAYFELGDNKHRKRQALLDILAGRL